MTDAIGPSSPLPPPTPPFNTDVPKLAQELHTQTVDFSTSLQKLLDDPSLASESAFLQQVVNHLSHLHQTVEEAIKLR